MHREGFSPFKKEYEIASVSDTAIEGAQEGKPLFSGSFKEFIMSRGMTAMLLAVRDRFPSTDGATALVSFAPGVMYSIDSEQEIPVLVRSSDHGSFAAVGIKNEEGMFEIRLPDSAAGAEVLEVRIQTDDFMDFQSSDGKGQVLVYDKPQEVKRNPETLFEGSAKEFFETNDARSVILDVKDRKPGKDPSKALVSFAPSSMDSLDEERRTPVLIHGKNGESIEAFGTRIDANTFELDLPAEALGMEISGVEVAVADFADTYLSSDDE